ncbi:hypothetical protein [Roseibium sp.]|uniref:hypothetical protein n=1 Tax=Roseibium sp. TaxID=1936156 RepID=UPI003A974785
MSLPEAARSVRTKIRSTSLSTALRPALGLATCLLLGAGLAACQVRPLLSTVSQTSAATGLVQDQLAAIEIDTISASYDVDKDAQRELYNELSFLFERGAGSPEKLYRLKILMDLNVAEVGVEQLADVPAAYTLTVNTTFVLENKQSETTMMTGKSFATASYDFSNQRFANIRAKRDARQRAARVIANDIQARIAGYFATN